jgi:acetyl-CoA carboxylase biotin carboxylase subunit
MFNKILIANRGEIAVRVIRACKELGIKTVAVYSTADKESLHVKLADEKVCIGDFSPKSSYLNINNIISAALLKKVDAIHPGYGFLSENPEFAAICEDVGLKFIGPKSEVIEKLGKKDLAKKIMEEHNVPVVPGPAKGITDPNEALKIAKDIGFPVVIKAVSGGGGRGIRFVYNENDFIQIFQEASHEADISFNDPSLYIEKMILDPKHIEFQILADERGNCIHLLERDCSAQRRKQKVIEETPSVMISNEQKKNLGAKIVKALTDIGYTNAGTVEFLYENGNFYFMEVNTRIQVEHPVTETATGIDIVKEQIKIAAGEKLKIKQQDVNLNLHAIECRINAEDPEKNFMPSAGKIENIIFPGGNGIRVDTAVYPGYIIPPYYDSMIMKLISFGESREVAIAKAIRALQETYIEGIKSNVNFLLKILTSDKFLKGTYTINFIEKELLKK